MSRRAPRLTSIGLVIAVVATYACGRDDPGTTGVTPTPTASNVSITPNRDTLTAIGATRQLTAVAKDANGNALSGRTFTWTSLQPTVASVSDMGLVTAVGNGTATITAATAGVQDSATIVVSQQAVSVAIAPDSSSILVNQSVVYQLDARDNLDNAIDTAQSRPSWQVSDTSLANVSRHGVLHGTAVGDVEVWVTVGNLSDTAYVHVTSPPPPITDTTTVSGTVTIPPSIDITGVSISTVMGGVVPVQSDGSFQIASSGEAESTVFANNGDVLFGLAIVPVQPTTGTQRPATPTIQGIRIDSLSTAVSLVYLTPFLSSAPSSLTDSVLMLIEALPETATLASAIANQVNVTGKLPDSTDNEFNTALINAVQAAHNRLAVIGGFADAARLLRSAFTQGDAPNLDRSGIEITFPTTVSADVTMTVENVYGRYVDMYVANLDDDGILVEDLTDLGGVLGFLNDRALLLRPADYVRDLTRISEWLDWLTTRRWSFTDSQPLLISFTQEQPRKLLLGYGPGLSNLSGDLEVVAGDENLRWVAPVAATFVFEYLAPVVKSLTGKKFALDEIKTTRQGIEALLLAGFDLSTCIVPAKNTNEVYYCVFAELRRFFFANPDLLKDVIVAILGSGASESADFYLNQVVPWLKIGSLAATLGDLFVSSYHIGIAELREDFDISYNGLLGASNVTINANTDNQRAVAGTALPERLEVRVSNHQDRPVEGAWVEWETEGNNGVVGSRFSTTDANGRATVEWTLGSTVGTQTATASLAGTSITQAFTGTALGNGDIEVVTSTTGTDLDPDGYRFTIDGGSPLTIGINETVTITDLVEGDHTIQISGVASNCSVTGANPLTVTVGQGTTSVARFDITCSTTSAARIFAASGQGLGSPPSDLYLVQASATGTDSLIGRVRTSGGFQPVMTDLALAPDGSLWGISFSKLYRLDKTTATATEVGNLTVPTANALAFDSNGNLFGATNFIGSLLQINTITGTASIIGPFGSGLISLGDLAFAPDGQLFAAVKTLAGVGILVTVDPSTGEATPVNPGTPIGFEPWGLAFVGSELFGLTTDLTNGTGELIKIDTNVGIGSLVRDLLFDAFGAGTPPARGPNR